MHILCLQFTVERYLASIIVMTEIRLFTFTSPFQAPLFDFSDAHVYDMLATARPRRLLASTVFFIFLRAGELLLIILEISDVSNCAASAYADGSARYRRAIAGAF